MRYSSPTTISRLVAVPAILLLGLSACHDSPRSNPLDPELTPAVELAAAANDTAGTVSLSWTPYAGETPFGQYLVLRNAAHSTVVETLFVALSPDSIRFVDRDRQPDTAYEYRVAAVNQAGLSRESTTVTVPGYTVQGVRLLAAEADSLAGVIRLRWTHFNGPGFQEYRVVRRVTELAKEEPLAQLTAAADTVYTDTTAQAGVPYVYRVEVEGAGRVEPGNLVPAQLQLPAVVIGQTDFSSRTAAASLTWHRYVGPRFWEYRLERRSAGTDWQQVTVARTVADTAFIDQGLQGNTDYAYRVVVLTERGEEVVGGPAPGPGSIHGWVKEWPLAMPGQVDRVRLYWDRGQLAVLLSGYEGVILCYYDREGALIRRDLLLDWSFTGYMVALRSNQQIWVPTGSCSAAPLGNGEWLVGLVDPTSDQYVVLRFDAEGQPKWRRQELGTWTTTGPLPDGSPRRGELTVRCAGNTAAPVRNMEVYAVSIQGVELQLDGAVSLSSPEFASRAAWQVAPTRARFEPDEVLLGSGLSLSAYRDARWQQARATVQLILAGEGAGLRLGPRGLGPSDWAWQLWLPLGSIKAVLNRPPGPAGQQADTLALPFPLVSWVPYRVIVETQDSTATAWLEHPIYWQVALPDGIEAASLAARDGDVAMVAGDQAMTLLADGSIKGPVSLPGVSSELRWWPRGATADAIRGMGVCLPDQHQVVYALAQQPLWLLAGLARTYLGARLDGADGSFILPLSLAIGPDGRIYVLDAATGQIQTFRASGKYVTRWGRPGTGPGEFNFGQGLTAAEYAGSIAVDDQGFIYVADPGNQRIQKFAP